jgi:hypothetical protein
MDDSFGGSPTSESRFIALQPESNAVAPMSELTSAMRRQDIWVILVGMNSSWVPAFLNASTVPIISW